MCCGPGAVAKNLPGMCNRVNCSAFLKTTYRTLRGLKPRQSGGTPAAESPACDPPAHRRMDALLQISSSLYALATQIAAVRSISRFSITTRCAACSDARRRFGVQGQMWCSDRESHRAEEAPDDVLPLVLVGPVEKVRPHTQQQPVASQARDLLIETALRQGRCKQDDLQ